jgi:hypothetical protein
MRPARRPCGGRAADQSIGVLKRIDESERDVRARLDRIIVDRGIDIFPRPRARDHRFVRQDGLRCVARSRSP